MNHPAGSWIMVVLLVLIVLPSADAAMTTRVSVSSSGIQGNDGSWDSSLSANGGYLAFASSATNLVAGDTNECNDIFVRDLRTGRTDRVSVRASGVQANGDSAAPALSADGRYVAFESDAGNLVAGDTNRFPDIFIHDRERGKTERVSVSSSGDQANEFSYSPSVSADGRYVAFLSYATNLVARDTTMSSDIFIHDRATGRTYLVSKSSAGVQGNDDSWTNSLSADGRYVAFDSAATNLVTGDTNGKWDVFVRDLRKGKTERVSESSSGAQGNGNSGLPTLSADGRYVVFESDASNLVAGDTNGKADIFVHDRKKGKTFRVSVSSSRAQGNNASQFSAISADGRYIAFGSAASNLDDGDTNGVPDVFVRDQMMGKTIRISVKTSGAQGNRLSFNPKISADGRHVAFNSHATNLVAGDTNGMPDIFLRSQWTN